MPGDSSFCASCGRALNSAPSKAGAEATGATAVPKPARAVRRRRASQSPGSSLRWLGKPWLVVSAVFLAFFLVLLPGLLYVWAGLPSTSNLSTARLPLSTRIYDRTGTVLLAEIHQGSDRRHVVPISAIGQPMRQATVDIEDRGFYQHGGVSVLSLLRAGFQDLVHLRIEAGGSTITQQLVKNIYLSEDRSVFRKLDEVILALEIEHQYSKSQILEAYLNRVYYGNRSYGVEAAAQTYFGKPASQLTLPEASLLAGLPQAPSELDPYSNLDGARARQRLVLDAMVKAHDLTQAQATAAFAQKPVLQPRSSQEDVKAPHFVHWVAAQLEKAYGNELLQTGGLTVVTTLDWRLQSIAEQQVRQQVGALQGHHVTDGAMVALDPMTGAVLAMVGSAGQNAPGSQYNMAVLPRQPGSSFKLFTYTAAIESGKYTMGSWIQDEPIQVRLADGSVYQPHNYDGAYHGWLPIPYALGNSLNVPAVKVEMGTGIDRVVDTARRMGVTTLKQAPSSYQPSLTLGGYDVPLIDMASGAATLASQGTRRQPQGVLKIVAHDGRALYTYDARANGQQALSPQVSFIMSQMLSDDRNRALEFGSGSNLVIRGHTVAAKTGTTNDFKDNLTIGYTPNLAVAVWVGNADDSPMHNVTGIVGAAPIFHGFMQQALNGQPDSWFAVPGGLTATNVNGYTAYLIPGTEQVAAANQPPPSFGGDEGNGNGNGNGGGGD